MENNTQIIKEKSGKTIKKTEEQIVDEREVKKLLKESIIMITIIGLVVLFSFFHRRYALLLGENSYTASVFFILTLSSLVALSFYLFGWIIVLLLRLMRGLRRSLL